MSDSISAALIPLFRISGSTDSTAQPIEAITTKFSPHDRAMATEMKEVVETLWDDINLVENSLNISTNGEQLESFTITVADSNLTSLLESDEKPKSGYKLDTIDSITVLDGLYANGHGYETGEDSLMAVKVKEDTAAWC